MTVAQMTWAALAGTMLCATGSSLMPPGGTAPRQTLQAPSRTIANVMPASDELTIEQLGALATSLGVTRYYVIAKYTVTVQQATATDLLIIGCAESDDRNRSIRVGFAQAHDEIARGLLCNLGSQEVVLAVADGMMALAPGEMAVVGNVLTMELAQPWLDGDSLCCFVRCPSGYYACCNCGPPCTCSCVKETQSVSCESGGYPATSCGVGCD